MKTNQKIQQQSAWSDFYKLHGKSKTVVAYSKMFWLKYYLLNAK